MLDRRQHDDTEARDSASGPGRPRLSPGRLLPFALLALGFALVFVLDLDRYLSPEALQNNRQALVHWVETAGGMGYLAYAAGYALVIALSLPGGALMTVLGGFLFGPVLGSVLAVVGATTGATVIFLAARYAFADYVRARLGRAIGRMQGELQESALSYLLFLRLVPVFPFWLVNLVPAVLGVRLGTYVVATAVGIVPASVVYALVGDGVGAVLEAGGRIDLAIIYEPRFLLPIIALALLALLPIAYKKLRRRR